MIRLVPIYHYQQNEGQGEFLTAVRNWLYTIKLFVFFLLCLSFVFLCGAGYERINHQSEFKEEVQHENNAPTQRQHVRRLHKTKRGL